MDLMASLKSIYNSADFLWTGRDKKDLATDSKVEGMKIAMSTGVFDMRKFIGQKFYHEHTKGFEANIRYWGLECRAV